MTTETETNRGRFFVTRLLPLLTGGAMFVLYMVTLNHSTSTTTVYRISELDGSYAPHRFFAPVTFLATYPLRWLSVTHVGAGLYFFTALCAALTLALLARSVVLLPHDRTHEQRDREFSESSILSIPTAWLPPIFAVLVCGLQMTFWENATNSAGQNPDFAFFFSDSPCQMLDLLLFAYSVRCLLEYRISFRISWIARFAFAYGLGMADNWLLLYLFPAFLGALIWIRGLSFFNSRFLLTLSLCGLAGLSFFFVFPIIGTHEHLPGIGFWDIVRHILVTIKSFHGYFPRELLLPLCLTSLIPIIVIGIRWASYFGDSSQIGIFFTTLIFHVFHAVFFMACLWVALDPPFGPRQKAYGIPLLPLYYLGALSIGYFAGYFLLIFGVRSSKLKHDPHPFIQAINYAIVAAVWVLAVSVPVIQVWKNLGQLHNNQAADAAFARMTSLAAQSLPAQPAVVLSDDRLRLLLLKNNLNHTGRASNYLLLDTALLDKDMTYLPQVAKAHADFLDPRDLPPKGVLSTIAIMHLFELLAKKYDIYYLHPSFGPFFERFYLEPSGLIYHFKPYDTNTWTQPALTPSQIEENNKAWKSITEDELPIITNIFDMPRRPITSPFFAYVMNSGHLTIESNTIAAALGSYYARSLDYWGVELQKAHFLPEAGTAFDNCLKFNPGSVAARVNLRFNQTLREGKKIVVETPAAVRDEFGRYRSWVELLGIDGPFDDPGFRYVLGETFAGGENYREGAPIRGGMGNYLQAIQQFQRVLELAPDYANAGLWLCKLDLFLKKYPEALAAANQILEHHPDDPGGLFYQAVVNMELHSYDKALEPLNRLVAKDEKNIYALLERAITLLELHRYEDAKADYEKLAKAYPKAYQVYYGLQEIAYQQKDTNAVVKNIELYLTNYYGAFPTNVAPPETEEVKSIKQRLKEFKNGAP